MTTKGQERVLRNQTEASHLLGDILRQQLESLRDSTDDPVQRERWQNVIDAMYGSKRHKSVGAL